MQTKASFSSITDMDKYVCQMLWPSDLTDPASRFRIVPDESPRIDSKLHAGESCLAQRKETWTRGVNLGLGDGSQGRVC
jgi:hypothetical protein